MSMHATPILYLNMGGEMLYVLQQRLKAQKIDIDKTVQGQSSNRNIRKRSYALFLSSFI